MSEMLTRRHLEVATNACLAIERFGMPEARIVLSQAVTYVACAPKSNAAYMAVDKALDIVKMKRHMVFLCIYRMHIIRVQESLDMVLI